MTRADSPRLIAWYLPQYHPIPENDAWWGTGFTDWANVVRARPRFPGHHQPRLPTELGFYDLRVPEVRRAQAELARAYGLTGFCYYHYWFNGRRLLERPFAEVLASGEPDLPFCLCWANENWTRAWDGLEHDVLIAQQYDQADDRCHLRALAPAFRDPRYIRVDGRPLFLVYRISALPDPRRTAAVWREEAAALGIGDLYLCTVESLRYDRVDPATVGFDAAVDFQPDWLALGPPDRRLSDDTAVYDYGRVVERMLARPEPSYLRFGGVMPGWDNTARRAQGAVVIHGATPERYQRWLARVAERAARQGPGTPVFVNAWNEWAEGAYLEPCARWGRAFLEATRAALAPPAAAAAATRPAGSRDEVAISVCIPAYDGARYLGAAIESVLAQSFRRFELVVVDDASTDDTAAVVAAFRDRRLTYVRNPTRLGLVGNWNRCLALARAPYLTLFHQDDVMRPDNLAQKYEFLEAHPSVGMVHSNVRQIGPDDRVLATWWYEEPGPSDASVHAGHDYFLRLLRGVNLVCCPSVVWRRSLYERLGGFDSRLPFTADWEMWMRIALFADVGYLTAALADYRRHDGNETTKFLGVAELEHAFLAKRIILEKHGDRVDDAAGLLRETAGRYRELALAKAAERYRAGAAAEARPYVDFAASLGPAAGGDAGLAWLADFVEAALAAPHAGGGAALPLRESPAYADALRTAFPRDLARHVTVRRIVKALLVKLKGQPGFRWLQGFEAFGARLLR